MTHVANDLTPQIRNLTAVDRAYQLHHRAGGGEGPPPDRGPARGEGAMLRGPRRQLCHDG